MKRYITLFLVFLLLVGCKSDSDKADEAASNYTLIVNSIVDSKIPEISQGNIEFLSGNYQEAIRYYESALKKNRSVAYYNIGVAYYLMRNIAKAEENFKLALVDEPAFEEALQNLVVVLAEQGKSAEADQYISKLKNTPMTAKTYVDLANIAIQTGNTAKAAYYYDLAIDLDSSSDFVLSNYANYLISLGATSDGQEILEQLTKKNFSIYYNLAYLYWIQNNKNEALDYAKKALDAEGASMEGEDKLANLFRQMKMYDLESDTLRRLIEWSREKDYRVRLVLSYLHSGNIDKAEDEAEFLLKDYPDDLDVILTYYNVLIITGNHRYAGQFINDYYEKLKSDVLLYYLVKYESIYDRKNNNSLKYIDQNRSTPYLNLARVVYYLSQNNISKASQYLDNVSETTNNDYYIYKTFLLLEQNKMRDAEAYASKIDIINPEYFWYNFIIYWNLRDSEKVSTLINDAVNDYISKVRVPHIKLSLIPVKEDLSFAYSFDNHASDIAGQLLYPIFIEPDEIYPFTALGYRFLEEHDKKAALQELERSIEFSSAVSYNNKAVSEILDFNYLNAIDNLTIAEEYATINPFIQFNMGIAYYFYGDFFKAKPYFDAAIKYNEYFIPAYVAAGLCLLKSQEYKKAKDYFNKAITNMDAYRQMHKDLRLPVIEDAGYLSYIANNNISELLKLLSDKKNKNTFLKGLENIANYILIQDVESLVDMRNNPFYRSYGLDMLIRLSNVPLSSYNEIPLPDYNVLMGEKYITAVRNKTFNTTNIELYMTNKMILVDIINIALILNNRSMALEYLIKSSTSDNKFLKQYEAALYYFLWIGDYVNAEASYMTLQRMNYTNKFVEYYIILYFLLNYNSKKLEPYLTSYLKDYPDDYRGILIDSFNKLMGKNAQSFISGISSLISKDPFLLNKVSIYVNVNQF